MSEMSHGPLVLFPTPSGPPVPEWSAPFHEAVRGGPWAVPAVVQGGPSSPPYRGDRGPDRLSNGITGANRRASIRVHTCHSPILVGLDADRCAMSVGVDPWALTPAGEVWALTAERSTYELQGGRLFVRDRWRIRGHPAGAVVTLAEHRCGQPPPPEFRQPAAIPTAPVDKEPF